MSEQWNVLRLLTWTTDYLKQRGAENPRLDAEVLLASALGCERIMLYAQFDSIVSDDVRAKFRDLVKRRAEGAPVAYLVGKKEFYSLPLRVTPDVLVPRPETEFVVVAALDALKAARDSVAGSPPRSDELLRVADVGTGSGAIAIAIARHCPECRVTAIDISPQALAVARENAAALGVVERIEFVEGDLLSGVPAERQFTVVASNPPYVTEAEYAELAPGVREYEPKLALVSGLAGTEVIERLIPQAADRLAPGGMLLIELSPMIAARVSELIAADGRFEPAVLRKDLAGHARVAIARRLA